MRRILASEQSEIGPIPAASGFAGRPGQDPGHNRPFSSAGAHLSPRRGTQMRVKIPALGKRPTPARWPPMAGGWEQKLK